MLVANCAVEGSPMPSVCNVNVANSVSVVPRSEERRVGKEGRSRLSLYVTFNAQLPSSVTEAFLVVFTNSAVNDSGPSTNRSLIHADDSIRVRHVTGVLTYALLI